MKFSTIALFALQAISIASVGVYAQADVAKDEDRDLKFDLNFLVLNPVSTHIESCWP